MSPPRPTHVCRRLSACIGKRWGRAHIPAAANDHNCPMPAKLRMLVGREFWATSTDVTGQVCFCIHFKGYCSRMARYLMLITEFVILMSESLDSTCSGRLLILESTSSILSDSSVMWVASRLWPMPGCSMTILGTTELSKVRSKLHDREGRPVGISGSGSLRSSSMSAVGCARLSITSTAPY